MTPCGGPPTIKVLHICSGNLYGGVERVLTTLATCRCLAAMEPHFALCFEGRLSSQLDTTGVGVYRLGNVRVRRPTTVRKARIGLREVLRDRHFDVVVCHSAWTQAIFAPAVRRAGLPVVFWLHGATAGRHWLERWARSTPPDAAICNSIFSASTLPSLYAGVRSEVLYCPVVLPDGVPLREDRAIVRAGLGTPVDATVVVQVGRMEASKGHEAHLEALALLRDVPGLIMWQVGDAQRSEEISYFERLRKTAIRLDVIHRIRFCGWRTDIARVLAAADLYCQPNVAPEGFGITFLEALSVGLPVVTTAIGSAAEIVDDTCGILVAPNDAHALAAVLRRLIQSPALRAQLGASGPARARTLCNPRDQLVRLYELLAPLAGTRHSVSTHH
jgi:glycosyltransferase involved in cell wall biosynthesis